MPRIFIVLVACVLLCGCATPKNILSAVIGNSTQEIDEWRPEAEVKIFDYDYKTCYAKAEEILKKMPKVVIYAKRPDLIAVFYLTPDTTPVGLYFGSVDASRTQVEISSPSTPAKLWVAQNVFGEKVLEAEKTVVKIEKADSTAKSVL